MEQSRALPGRVAFKRLPRESAWLDYLRKVSEGDETAFSSLYDETNALVYGLAMRMLANGEDAEEVTLDVYNQVWRTAKRFDGDRGTVTAWLMTMTRTRSLDRIRARTSRQRNVDAMPAAFDTPANTLSPEEESSSSEQRRIVMEALRQLPVEQRKALEMAYFQGLSHSELAAELGEPLGTVKTRIRLGMTKLRELLTVAAGEAAI